MYDLFRESCANGLLLRLLTLESRLRASTQMPITMSACMCSTHCLYALFFSAPPPLSPPYAWRALDLPNFRQHGIHQHH